MVSFDLAIPVTVLVSKDGVNSQEYNKVSAATPTHPYAAGAMLNSKVFLYATGLFIHGLSNCLVFIIVKFIWAVILSQKLNKYSTVFPLVKIPKIPRNLNFTCLHITKGQSNCCFWIF